MIPTRTLFLLLATAACMFRHSLHAQQKSEPSDTTLLREVSINGQRQRISYRLDRQRIDAGQMLTAQGGTALDVLRAVPGVTVDADGTSRSEAAKPFRCISTESSRRSPAPRPCRWWALPTSRT